MMFLDTQNQFDPELLEPAYAEAYAAFAEENKEVLYTWGKEDIARRFSDYLSKKVEKDLVTLIEASPADEAKKKQDLSLAKRGQLLLVSTDDGKNFDQYLTIEDAKRVNPIAYQILSPTFRSNTTNLMEVVGEQTLLHVVSTMNQNFSSVNAAEKTIWSVKEATLKNGVVHVEVSRTSSNPEALEDADHKYDIEVDQDPDLPLVYDEMDKNGNKKSFAETQLPSEYGEAKPDPTLQMPSPEEVLISGIANNDDGSQAAKNAVLVTGLTMLALQEAAAHASPEQRAREAAALAKSRIERPMATPETGDAFNVTAAKAAVAARFARQNQANKTSQEHEAARIEHSKIERNTVHAKKEAAEKKNKERYSADQKKLARNSAAGAGAAAALAGLLGSTSVFVTIFS